MTETHAEHTIAEHQHAAGCGHDAVQHGDHVDYITMVTSTPNTTVTTTSINRTWLPGALPIQGARRSCFRTMRMH